MAVDLSGKRIVVTGGAGTIGRAAAELFADKGARVLAVDIDKAGLDDITGARAEVATHVADVSTVDGVTSYVRQANDVLGGIDGFFNNAGVEGTVAPLGEHLVDDFDKVIATNLRGVFLGLTHVLPHLTEGASVVNTASSLGLVGAAGISPYVASKHGVIGLTKSAALEVAGRGIRVNAVCPGPIAGRMIEALEGAIFGDSGTTFANFVPMGRHGRPGEVASLVAYLLSDEAQYITGAAHEVDGAFTTP